MPTLREQLSDVLWAAFWPEATAPYGLAARREMFTPLVDECIRQMEWARSQQLEALRQVQGADQHDGQYDGCSLCSYHAAGWSTEPSKHDPDCPTGNAIAAPLTAAPEGWQP